MLHRLPHSLRVCALLLIIAALLAPAGPLTPTPARAAAALSVSPSAFSVTLPLGTTQRRSVTLTNAAGSNQSPRLFEAEPALASPASAAPSGPAMVSLPAQADRIDPQLVRELGARAGQSGDFLVFLREQADLSAAYQIADWSERGEYVYRTLTAWADRQQAQLRRQLQGRGTRFQPLWIVNALLVHGTLADARALAGRPEVALVRANRTTKLDVDVDAAGDVAKLCSPDQPSNPVCWNVRRLGADRVWREFGVDGSGVVVANVDTGVSLMHPALLPRYRGNLGGGRYDHNYNWFDPQEAKAWPFDDDGHGTHTMGTIVGGGGGGQPEFGMAPGARWVAAQGCGGVFCSDIDLIRSAQWMLGPTTQAGVRPRPDLRPMIINNSWASQGGDEWYAGYTAAWRAAGIFPVFAAGNIDGLTGQACGTISSPGDYPEVLAVGATDFANGVAAFSRLGPSIDGRIKPDFVAPGTHTSYSQGILSAGIEPNSPYAALQGTSMAAPLVTGLVALLWSANPTLIGNYDATYAILRDSAQRLSDTRCKDPAGKPNNVFGNGLANAYWAVRQARVDLPWISMPAQVQAVAPGGSASFEVQFDARKVTAPGVYQARLLVFGNSLTDAPATVSVTMNVTAAGQTATVSGQVISASDGQPLQARVTLGGGLSVDTDRRGSYTMTLALGSYDLVASAPAYFSAKQRIALSGSMRVDFKLAPDQPRIASATRSISAELGFMERRPITVPISNTGSRTLTFNAEILDERFAVWRSDEPGGPKFRWIDLPANAVVLKLDDMSVKQDVLLNMVFPFDQALFDEAWVTSDGILSFDRPFFYDGPTYRCLPDDEFNYYMIAPLRLDLDPSRGGRVRYATVRTERGRTFVLSYERVPLHDGPASQTYTFQLLLTEDGRVVFQYHTVPTLPSKASAGIQRAPLSVVSLGCGTTLDIRNGLAVEFRPQPSPTEWAALDQNRYDLPPGKSQPLLLTLSWTGVPQSSPYRARMQINSSDPLVPAYTIPITVSARRPPQHLWLPLMRGDIP